CVMICDERNFTMSDVKSPDIHDAVQSRYGAIATSAGPTQAVSCCGPTDSGACCGTEPSLYDPAMLEGVPQDAVNLSLGCGDPVSIATPREGETVLDLGSGGGIDCF